MFIIGLNQPGGFYKMDIKIWFTNGSYEIINNLSCLKDYDNVVSFEYLGALQ